MRGKDHNPILSAVKQGETNGIHRLIRSILRTSAHGNVEMRLAVMGFVVLFLVVGMNVSIDHFANQKKDTEDTPCGSYTG